MKGNLTLKSTSWIIPAFGIDKLQQQEGAAPEPAQGQVVVEVHACSLNYRDLLTVIGKYNPRMPLPRIPLSDGAGVVHAVGDGVAELKPGDRVAGIFMAELA